MGLVVEGVFGSVLDFLGGGSGPAYLGVCLAGSCGCCECEALGEWVGEDRCFVVHGVFVCVGSVGCGDVVGFVVLSYVEYEWVFSYSAEVGWDGGVCAGVVVCEGLVWWAGVVCGAGVVAVYVLVLGAGVVGVAVVVVLVLGGSCVVVLVGSAGWGLLLGWCVGECVGGCGG